MGMNNIVPEIWSNELIELLEKALLATSIANRDIAGEINSKGDTLHIIGMGDVAVEDYPTSGAITYSDTNDTDTELVIDIDKYFGLKFEDKNNIQANFDFRSPYVRRSVYKLKDAIDVLTLAEYANAGIVYDEAGSDWQFTKDTCADVPLFFAGLHKELDSVNASTMGRYLIAPPSAVEAFRIYFAQRGTSLGDQVMLNGFVTNVMGIDVYMSNNCANDGATLHGLAGVRGDSIAYAQQINPDSIETLRSESRFADLVRGRVLAGMKTYRAATLVDVEFDPTTIATS